MALKFFGQKIFDARRTCVGVELLVREVPHGQELIRTPFEIMEHPDFNSIDLYAIDMQLMTYLHFYEDQFKQSGMKYIFINLSDNLLSRLILGDHESAPFRLLDSLARSFMPLRVVVEVSERSRIRADHLALILDRLKSIGFLVAQDDYTVARQDYLDIDWDFIKVDLDTCSPYDTPDGANLVIEKSELNLMHRFDGSEYHQGFDFHYPQSLNDIFESTVSAKKRLSAVKVANQ